jgi:diguanylate cyclase (GGDEF)-like protein/PAS domain S-box-containing protein
VFVLASAISVLADVPTVFDVLVSGAGQQQLYFGLYVVAAWLFGASAYVQRRRAQSPDLRPVAAKLRGPSYSLLPYGALALVYASLAYEALRVARGIQHGTGSVGSPLLTLVAGAAVVTSFVVARQIVVLRRNAELVADRFAREAYFSALVERSSDMLVVIGRDGHIREASSTFARALGVTPAEVVGAPFIDFVDEDDRATAGADMAAVAADVPRDAEPRDAAPFEWRMRSRKGDRRWIEVVCTNMLGHSAVSGIVLNGRDVSERKQLEAELTHRAYHDALTGLVNRSAFVADVTRAFERRRVATNDQQGPGGGFAVMYVDLDGFKPVNDRYGHAAGDEVLIAVSERLRAATRGTDLVARLGGDEFAVFLDNVSGPADTEVVAARVCASLARPIRVKGGDVCVRASVGVAFALPLTSDDAASPVHAVQSAAEGLLHEADVAMYASKLHGGDVCTYASPQQVLRVS